jgi:hypothetical protein
MKISKRRKARPKTRTVRTAEESRREFERIWPKIQKIQAEVRRRGLAKDMLTDDDLYDEKGLPK